MKTAQQAYPLDWPIGWPRTDSLCRRPSNFGRRSARGWKERLTIAQARTRVLEELGKITKVGAGYRVPHDSIVISTNMQVRGDGLPYSGRRSPEDPGVAVYFVLDDQPHCLPCDRWSSVADNLAAVAAHISALRGIERWGVGDLSKAFSGYQALPSPDQVTARNWRDVLNAHNAATLEDVRLNYKKLAMKYHPDKEETGARDKFNEINTAWRQAKEAMGNE